MPSRLKITEFDAYEGIAFACIVSIAFVFLLQRPDVPIQTQKALWFVFIVATGLSLNPQPGTSIFKISLQALAPTVVLFVGMIIQNALQVAANSLYLTIISRPPVPNNDTVNYVNLGLWYVTLLMATWPAIIFAVVARRKLTATLKALFNADHDRLRKLEKAINTVMRIAVALGFGWLVSR